MTTTTTINRIKDQSPWYTYNGEEGILTDPRSNGWEDNGHGCTDFFAFACLSIERLQYLVDNPDAVHCTYDESYGDSANKGAIITDGQRTNYENDQKLVHNEWSLIENYQADEFERRWIRVGGQHYDWHNDDPLTKDSLIQFIKEWDGLMDDAKAIVDFEENEFLSTIAIELQG